MDTMARPSGNPNPKIKPYPGQERFYDGDLQTVEDGDWTPELALTACRALDLPTRAEQVDRIRDAVDEGVLPPAAIDVLVAAGWRELADAGD